MVWFNALNMKLKFRILSTALIQTVCNIKFLLKLEIILEVSTWARRASDPSPSILLLTRRTGARAEILSGCFCNNRTAFMKTYKLKFFNVS
jgi:hypothetical protein